MPVISIKTKVSFPSHLFILTEKYQDFKDLPAEVSEYIKKQLQGHVKEKGSEKKEVFYNHLGNLFSVIVIDKTKPLAGLAERIRKQAAAFADNVNLNRGKEIFIVNETTLPELALAAAEGAELSCYQFLLHKPTAKTKNSLRDIFIADKRIDQKEIAALNAVCEATIRARDLVNEPVNKLNAVQLSKAFATMGKEAGFGVNIYDRKKITALKMGGLLAVNAGSVDEPTFTVMEYKPSKAVNSKPYILVGKGVTYDTGGLSLKPTPNSMDLMKCDMAGGAAAGCAMYAIAKAKLPVHVIALVPATDNRPGFNAFAPGDIITMMDGSTVEMLNSDAEGRMILADALHYAKRYNPELVIDIATLTGAAMAAIGTMGIVGMGNANQALKDKIISSGNNVYERIAELPFWDEYEELFKSDIADRKNIGGPLAGAITAGKFLEKYTNYPYYHLDIAGPAFLPAKDSYRGKGGTGVGVRLFFDLFRNISGRVKK